MREHTPTTLRIQKREQAVKQAPVVLSLNPVQTTIDMRRVPVQKQADSVSPHLSRGVGSSVFNKLTSGALILFLLVNPSVIVFAATEEVVEEQPQEATEVVEVTHTAESTDSEPVDVFIAEEEAIQEEQETPRETEEDVVEEEVVDSEGVVDDPSKNEESIVDTEESTEKADNSENTNNEEVSDVENSEGVEIVEDTEESSEEVVDEVSDQTDDEVVEEEVVDDATQETDTENSEEEQTQTNTGGSGGYVQDDEEENVEEAVEEEVDNEVQENPAEEEVAGEIVGEAIEEVEEEIQDEPVIDEAAIRAEIEKVVEERIKREYEEKMKSLLNDRQNETLSISNFQSAHEFNDSDCELLSNNEIYCRKDGVESDQKTSVFTGVFTDDSADDSEIILQISGIATQITNNDYSDINPVYDEATGKVVWQSLVDGRWQVMLYDVNTAETVKVTGGGYNNINPHTFGNVIVWQGWAGSNWDIFYATQTVEESGVVSWETSRVTDNDWPDVEPQVVEGMILWEALIDESWQVFSFDVYTNTLTQVSQGIGDSKNPRLVLLYDSEDGDVTQLIGFDIATQESSVIDDGMNDEGVPQEIPESPLDENQAAMPGHENTTSNRTTKDAADGE